MSPNVPLRIRCHSLVPGTFRTAWIYPYPELLPNHSILFEALD